MCVYRACDCPPYISIDSRFIVFWSEVFQKNTIAPCHGQRAILQGKKNN